jgi:hypothetical protein
VAGTDRQCRLRHQRGSQDGLRTMFYRIERRKSTNCAFFVLDSQRSSRKLRIPQVLVSHVVGKDAINVGPKALAEQIQMV